MDSRAQQREKRIKHEMDTCIHFTGIHQEICKAGVRYRELVGGPDFGWACKIPCTEAFPGETERAKCSLKSTPTREQAEKEVAEGDNRMAKTLNAMKLAHQHAKDHGLGRGHGGESEMNCPICKTGELQYAVASVNGHMHARCTTSGCVSWME